MNIQDVFQTADWKKEKHTPGTLLATPHCNIHGLWASQKTIRNTA